jgi:glycogen debranching enzyme
MKFILITFLSILHISNVLCQSLPTQSISRLFEQSEKLKGKKEYLNSPYATAGDKLYMIGHQNGTFPDLGWHINGEMGGIWAHPIKIMDGFSISINQEKLDSAESFENFPFGNKIVYLLKNQNLKIERYQFVPDGKKGIYIEFKILNLSPKQNDLTINIQGISNLMPTWLGEKTQMIDSKDDSRFDTNSNAWISKDSKNSWYGMFGSTIKIFPKIGNITSLKENVSLLNSESKISLKPLKETSFSIIIAGSEKNQQELLACFNDIKSNATGFLKQKINRYQALNKNSEIELSDKELETAYKWIKYNTDWLIRDVDNQGRGLCAGLPDYPWWFGVDNEYTLKSLIATGQKKLVYDTIDLLYRLSEKGNSNGRIVHEVSTNGAVFNQGNVNETPQFASLIWEVFCWTGDKEFLKKYFPTIEKGLLWLEQENDLDKNLLPDGFGMMEIHGMNSEMIDVAVYTQKAFDDASKMATILEKHQEAKLYSEKATKIKTKINTDFWVPEAKSYADFIGTKNQALKLIDDAIIRADTLKKPWAVAELKNLKNQIENQKDDSKKGYVMHHNWVVNTPMEMGLADKEKALLALETAKKYSGTYGMYVTGIDRDQQENADEGSFAIGKKIFNYTGAVMTLPTGVQAVSANNYGKPDEAYSLLKKMLRSFSFALPGSIYEVSPDFGMFSQAWTLYAFGEPLIKQFFGIKPLAHKNTIKLQPLLPSTLKNGKIKKVVIADNIFEMSFNQSHTSDDYKIMQTKNWTLEFSQEQGKYKKWIVNGKELIPTIENDRETIRLNSLAINLKLIK